METFICQILKFLKKISFSANGVSECRWHSNRRTDRAGRRDMMHKDYLSNNKKVVFSVLLAEGKLYQHCAEIEKKQMKCTAF